MVNKNRPLNGLLNGPLLCSSEFLIFMNYFLDKNPFRKKILYLRDQYPSNFN